MRNGASIGPYRIIRKIGEGGMGGRVPRRTHADRRCAAIKVLLPELCSAWAIFVKAAATAKHAGDAAREAEANKRAKGLEARLLYVTVSVPDASRVRGLVVKRNDAVLDEASWDQRVPVDPDEYTISGEAPGYAPWSTSVIVKTRSKTVEVPVLDKRPEPPPDAAAPREAAESPAAAPLREAAESPGAEDARPPAATSSFTARRCRWCSPRSAWPRSAAAWASGARPSATRTRPMRSARPSAPSSPRTGSISKRRRGATRSTPTSGTRRGRGDRRRRGAVFTGSPMAHATASVPILDAGRVGVGCARSF